MSININTNVIQKIPRGPVFGATLFNFLLLVRLFRARVGANSTYSFRARNAFGVNMDYYFNFTL